MSEPKVTIITPTGDRARSFALLERFVARQTYAGEVQWIVVDDGRTPLDPSGMYQYIRREPREDDPEHTLGVNLLAAIPHVEGEFVFFYEDDDRKAADHLAHYVKLLANHDIVGEGRARYYHLPTRRWKRHRNTGHASLSDTACRRWVLNEIERIIRADPADYFIDLKLWKLDARRHVFTDEADELVLNTSLKGLPGRRSPVGGHHRVSKSGQHDPDLSQLRRWTGDDFDLYEPLTREATRVAIVSQGGTARLYPGPEGYQAVIAVNSRVTQIEATHWAFSDVSAWGKWHRQRIGTPTICTRQEKARKILAADDEDGRAFADCPSVLYQDQLGIPPVPTGGAPWNRFSGPGALGVAWSLRPGRIDCYGCDMGGETDAPGSNRTADRWRRERNIWAEMTRRMAAEGIEVMHMTPNGAFVPAAEFLGEVAEVAGDRRWQFKNQHGWVTQTFNASTRADFLALLERMIGPERAATAEIREVP